MTTRWLAIVGAVVFAGASASGAPRPQQSGSSATAAAPSKPAATPSTKKTSSKKKKRAKREPTQMAPTPERISEIQSALSRGGYYGGNPNGKWDSTTVAAMQKFQSSNGLDASGKIDALSLQKLGLGSSVAGVSAPKPITPPSPANPAAPAHTVPSQASPSSAPAPSSSARASDSVSPRAVASTAAPSSTPPAPKPPKR
jgi:peptidoglycan hydrolase-like protein with peptidoglycan-binding domain